MISVTCVYGIKIKTSWKMFVQKLSNSPKDGFDVMREQRMQRNNGLRELIAHHVNTITAITIGLLHGFSLTYWNDTGKWRLWYFDTNSTSFCTSLEKFTVHALCMYIKYIYTVTIAYYVFHACKKHSCK